MSPRFQPEPPLAQLDRAGMGLKGSAMGSGCGLLPCPELSPLCPHLLLLRDVLEAWARIRKLPLHPAVGAKKKKKICIYIYFHLNNTQMGRREWECRVFFFLTPHGK